MNPANDEENPSCGVKPIIKELVRTEVCFPDLKLLVDKVYIVNLSNPDDRPNPEAFRLYLSDGEKMIQALLPRRIHDTVSSGLIREGSYVVLQRYRLVKGKKRVGQGNIGYLVIEDWYTVGDEERDPRDPVRITDGLGQVRSKDTDSLSSTSPLRSNSKDGDAFASLAEDYGNQTREVLTETPATRANIGLDHYTTESMANDAHSTSAVAGERKRPASGEALGDIDANTSLVQNNTKRIKRATDRKHSTIDSPTEPSEFNPYLVAQGNHTSPSNRNEYHNTTATAVARSTSTRTPVETVNNLPPTTKAKSLAISSSMAPCISRSIPRAPISRETALPISRPLRIQPLRSILFPNNRRNSIVDVLAVITFVSPHVVTPPRLPPKRDLRLLDPSCPSTRQPVLFSVFVDPDRFRPAVGTVALFRSVTTHEWNGGSLNAYDKDCMGRKWFHPNPVGVVGCDVQALKDCYQKWLDEEQKKEAEKELLKALELEERQRAG